MTIVSAVMFKTTKKKYGIILYKNSAKKDANINVLEIWPCEYGNEAMRINKLYSRIWAQ